MLGRGSCSPDGPSFWAPEFGGTSEVTLLWMGWARRGAGRKVSILESDIAVSSVGRLLERGGVRGLEASLGAGGALATAWSGPANVGTEAKAAGFPIPGVEVLLPADLLVSPDGGSLGLTTGAFGGGEVSIGGSVGA